MENKILYSLYFNKDECKIQVKKAEKQFQDIKSKISNENEIYNYNSFYCFSFSQSVLKEKAKEIRNSWLEEAEKKLAKIKEISIDKKSNLPKQYILLEEIAGYSKPVGAYSTHREAYNEMAKLLIKHVRASMTAEIVEELLWATSHPYEKDINNDKIKKNDFSVAYKLQKNSALITDSLHLQWRIFELN